MSDYALFNNSGDIHCNQTVASKTGHGPGFKSAMAAFAERGIPNYNYVILRRHREKPNEVKTFTNLFGEIPGMGDFPWVFDL